MDPGLGFRPADVLDLVHASSDERVQEIEREQAASAERLKLKRTNSKKYNELYGQQPPRRPRERFVLRTLYLLRVSMVAQPDSNSNAMLLKLCEIMRHPQCFLASLVSFLWNKPDMRSA